MKNLTRNSSILLILLLSYQITFNNKKITSRSLLCFLAGRAAPQVGKRAPRRAEVF
jgi:hypothetical protein